MSVIFLFRVDVTKLYRVLLTYSDYVDEMKLYEELAEAGVHYERSGGIHKLIAVGTDIAVEGDDFVKALQELIDTITSRQAEIIEKMEKGCEKVKANLERACTEKFIDCVKRCKSEGQVCVNVCDGLYIACMTEARIRADRCKLIESIDEK